MCSSDLPKLERAVIGHIAAGDCEQLEYDWDTAKECFEKTEAVLTMKLTDKEREAANNTINALRDIIEMIGTIDTIECEMCGDTVLESSCTLYEHKNICKSCEREYMRQYHAKRK